MRQENAMKKILLFLVFVFAAINVTAQERVVYYKKNKKKTYFHVITEGKKDEYYSTFNTRQGLINPEFSFETKYNKKGYDKINVAEEILDLESPSVTNNYREQSAGGVTNKSDDLYTHTRTESGFMTSVCFADAKDVSAKAIGNISTSSGFEVGNSYKLLKVTRAEDKSLIGCYVTCQVIESRKSNIFGSEGRLTLRPICIEKQDGTQVRLQPTDIQRRGLNRTNIKFWTSLLIIPVFVPGSRAEIKQNESIELRLE